MGGALFFSDRAPAEIYTWHINMYTCSKHLVFGGASTHTHYVNTEWCFCCYPLYYFIFNPAKLFLAPGVEKFTGACRAFNHAFEHHLWLIVVSP